MHFVHFRTKRRRWNFPGNFVFFAQHDFLLLEAPDTQKRNQQDSSVIKNNNLLLLVDPFEAPIPNMLFLTFVIAFVLLVNAYATDYPPVRVELYYEALCPGKLFNLVLFND